MAVLALSAGCGAPPPQPEPPPATGPVLTTTRPPLTTTTIAPVPQQRVYTVEAGDYLGRIAQGFGITVAALKEANGLTSDTIRPGDTLIIPFPPDETDDGAS